MSKQATKKTPPQKKPTKAAAGTTKPAAKAADAATTTTKPAAKAAAAASTTPTTTKPTTAATTPAGAKKGDAKKRGRGAAGKAAQAKNTQGDESKKQVQSIQEEAAKLEAMEKEVDGESTTNGQKAADTTTTPPPTEADAAEKEARQKLEDARSVYVGNVDYKSTPEELQTLFQPCGAVKRVTILCDKFTGRPRGFAYVEFAEEESVNNAKSLDNATFHERQIKVTPKRTNLPGVTVATPPSRGRGRGRGGRGRGARGGRGSSAGGRGGSGEPKVSKYTPYNATF